MRVEGGSALWLRVFAQAALDVKRSAKLLEELNASAARSAFTKVYWRQGSVTVEYAVPAFMVTDSSMGMMCGEVLQHADHLGPLLTAVYGGSTPLEVPIVSDDADHDAA